MYKMLVVNHFKCTGCRLCELMCSAVKEGEFKPASSRIRVTNDSRVGISIPHVCLQCENPWCQEACTYDAIDRNANTGALVIDREKCVGCGECIPACPYGMIHLNDRYNIAAKCDLCDSQPRCVEACYPRAIKAIEYDDLGIYFWK